jgi:hypothetical protein
VISSSFSQRFSRHKEDQSNGIHFDKSQSPLSSTDERSFEQEILLEIKTIRPKKLLNFIRLISMRLIENPKLTLTREEEQIFAQGTLYLADFPCPYFQNKYQLILFFINRLMRTYAKGETLDRSISKIKNVIDSQVLDFFSFRSKPSLEKSCKIKEVLRRINLNSTKKSPPKRYIGVGYKDKGQYRDEAFDGSPDWQEVASQLYEEDQIPFLGWNALDLELLGYEELKFFRRRLGYD